MTIKAITSIAQNMQLPIGVKLNTLITNHDSRGNLTEIFRREWFKDEELNFLQWNAVSSVPGSFRGIHVHIKHSDYLTVLQGEGHFFMKDLRPNSDTYLQENLVVLKSTNIQTLYFPPGVAHAFYFPVQSIHIYAVSEYWDKADDLGCRFDANGINYKFPDNMIISERDNNLGSLEDLRKLLPINL